MIFVETCVLSDAMKVCMQQFLHEDNIQNNITKEAHRETFCPYLKALNFANEPVSIILGRKFYLPTTYLNTFPHNLCSSCGSQTENLKKSK